MRQHRTSVDLPSSLVDAVRQQALAHGTNVSNLFFHWATTAARLAVEGQGHLLPQQHGLRSDSLGDVREVRWLQSKEDYARYQALIMGAGSSMAAALQAAAEAYVEAGGDAVMMAWPPKSAYAAAA
jgi:hypothetical protein